VKYQGSAIAVFLGQESGELIDAAEGRFTEPFADIACRNGGDLKLGQSGDACLHLLRTVLQYCIHNRQTGRGVADAVPFGNEGNDPELVQTFFLIST